MQNLSNRATGYPGQSLSSEEASRRLLRVAGANLPQFADEKTSASVYPIRITNGAAAAKIIVLHPGALTLAEIADVLGLTADGIAKDGTVITSVECTTKQGTKLEYLQKFVNQNPTRITRISVNATSEEQLDEAIVFAKVNPLTKLGLTEIVPSTVKKETNTNTKLVTLNFKNLQLDDQTVAYVTILPGVTLSLNLFMGATSNAAANLARQAEAYFGQ